MLTLTIDQKDEIKTAVRKMRERGGASAAKTALEALSLLQNCPVNLTLIQLDTSIQSVIQDDIPFVNIWVSDGIYEYEFSSYATKTWGLTEYKRVSVWFTTKYGLASGFASDKDFLENPRKYIDDEGACSLEPSSRVKVRAYLCRENATSGRIAA